MNSARLRDWILSLLDAKGSTQGSVADRLGITQSTVSKIKRNRHYNFSLNAVADIARAMNAMSMSDFFRQLEQSFQSETKKTSHVTHPVPRESDKTPLPQVEFANGSTAAEISATLSDLFIRQQQLEAQISALVKQSAKSTGRQPAQKAQLPREKKTGSSRSHSRRRE